MNEKPSHCKNCTKTRNTEGILKAYIYISENLRHVLYENLGKTKVWNSDCRQSSLVGKCKIKWCYCSYYSLCLESLFIHGFFWCYDFLFDGFFPWQLNHKTYLTKHFQESSLSWMYRCLSFWNCFTVAYEIGN